MSTPPYNNTYMRLSIDVSGQLISLWCPTNSLLVHNKYFTTFDTKARSKQHVRIIQWRLTTYIR